MKDREQAIVDEAAFFRPVDAGHTAQMFEGVAGILAAWEEALAGLQNRRPGKLALSQQHEKTVKNALGSAIVGLSLAAGAMREATESAQRDFERDASSSQ